MVVVYSIDGGYWMDFQPLRMSINYDEKHTSHKWTNKSTCNLDQNLDQDLVGHFHGWSSDNGGEHWLR